MPSNKTPLLKQQDSAKSTSPNQLHGIQLLVRQSLHLLRLLLRLKASRVIFLLGAILLMHYNPLSSLISKHKSDIESKRIMKGGLKFYGASDFAASGHKVLVDRSTFPAEAAVADRIVADGGGVKADWAKDCTSEIECRAEFVGERDPAVIAYIRYSLNQVRAAILECFWVTDSNLRCAFLYHLMAQSMLQSSPSDNVFKDVQFFALNDVSDKAENEKPKNRTTNQADQSICAAWMDRYTYYKKLQVPITLITIGLSFYFLITTVSFVRTIKMGGFYQQQLVRNGLSVTAYWSVVWLVTISECATFSLLFALSHVWPCPGVFPARNIGHVFLMLCLYFLDLAALALLLEILIPSMVAISMLMLVIGVALNIAIFQYDLIKLQYSAIYLFAPPISVKDYVATYMTAGVGSDDNMPVLSLVDEKPEHYQTILGMNFATALLLVLLTIYTDFLLLSGNGLCLPPFFPFTRSFWCPTGKTTDGIVEPNDGTTEPHIEPVIGLSPSIAVDKVSKTYRCCPCLPPSGPAVLQELSCKIYKNQITALIGHNGAGKSTLIKILTGDECPDSGAAFIDGRKVTDPLERLTLRGTISVCPQFDALCDALSVIECIQITLTSKGLGGDVELNRAQAMLQRLGLGDKENVRSIDLSGGQKRKVSTILALLGDPKVVFLDEPTSGLDPVSRRQLWQLLQEEKLGRSIVLCTQFMDEADILADRKIFLCGGKIVCAGSSAFLKRAFGCSFTINVSLKSERDAQKVLARLQQVQLKSQFKTELQLEVTSSKPYILIKAVQVLEGSSEVEAFGLSQANLDDVFMKLSDVSSDEVIDAFHSGNLSKLQEKSKNDAKGKDKVELSRLLDQSQKVKPSNFVQFKAMLSVNLKKQWRTSSTFWSRYVVSAMLLLVMTLWVFLSLLMFTMVAIKNSTNSSGPMTIEELNDLPVNAKGYASARQKVPMSTTVRSIDYADSDNLKTVCIYDSGIEVESLDRWCNNLTLSTENDTEPVNPMSKPRLESLRTFLLKKATLANLRQRCGVSESSCTRRYCKVCVVYYASSWNNTEPNAGREISIGIFVRNQRMEIATVHAYRRALTKVWRYFGVGELENATAASHIKPLSQFIDGDVMLMPLLIIFCLFPVSYLTDPTDDMVSRVRSQLLSMGMRHHAYWMNLFCLHWIQYSVCFAISVGILFMLDKYTHWYFVQYVVLPVLIFGTTSNQLTMYLTANITRASNTIVTLTCNFVAILLPILLLVFSSKMSIILTMVVLLPPIAPIALMLFGLLPAMYTKEYYLADNISSTPGAFDNYWNHSYVLWPFVMMPVHTVVMCCIMAMVENKDVLWALCSPTKQLPTKSPDKPVGTMDQGAQKEHDRLMKTANNPENVLEVRELNKTYANGVHAVRGVTFGVVAGEIFGLLGANGAGKSTSMSVIVGEDTASGGSVQVRSQDGEWFTGRAGASMGFIGYCPQHNPLFDFITVAEHLELYANIRGVPSSTVQRQVGVLMHGLGLQPHKDKRSSQLSGGNKRRLCLAIALLGDPTLVVIDEASTGVDPENKRFIWGAIRGMLHSKRSVMVTTHSMEEVEALCHRVGIMNRGRLIAFGTVQQMRSLYGDAYTLDVLVGHEEGKALQLKKSAIRSAIASQFKGSALLEDLGLCMQFGVPKTSVGSLSNALKWLDSNQSRLAVLYYAFYQMSLDQVFVKLVKHYDSSAS